MNRSKLIVIISLAFVAFAALLILSWSIGNLQAPKTIDLGTMTVLLLFTLLAVQTIRRIELTEQNDYNQEVINIIHSSFQYISDENIESTNNSLERDIYPFKNNDQDLFDDKTIQ